MSCIALVSASIYFMAQASDSEPIYRRMLPYLIATGFFALLTLYPYIIELFVASYSGSIYEIESLTTFQLAWIVISVFLTLLPLVGLIPRIGNNAILLVLVGSVAALPSVLALIQTSKDTTKPNKAEMATPRKPSDKN